MRRRHTPRLLRALPEGKICSEEIFETQPCKIAPLLGLLLKRWRTAQGGNVITVNTTTPRMADALLVGSLHLRVLSLDDAVDLHMIFSDPATHTIGDGPFTDIQRTREWLDRRWQRREQHGVTWYSARLPDETMIGVTGLSFGRTGEQPEFGFEIDHRLQRRGHGRAVAAAVVAEAHRAGFARVWATVRPWNEPSLRALARVGFTRDRVESDHKGDLIYLFHDSK